MAWRIVIAGGGFGGFYAARALERLLAANSAEVTLVNEANFMLYTPLLPGAAGATLDPRHVVVPLRSQLRETDLVIGELTGGDPAHCTLGVKRIDAQHAIRQGRLVARNVVATLGNGKVRRFRYRTKGVVAELGHNQAAALTLGVRWRGLPAWFIARTYHLLLMPGVGRKLRLLVDWNVALLFGRDTWHLGAWAARLLLRRATISTGDHTARRPVVS